MSSDGQVRIVTKSGGNRFSGNASYFYRDDSLQANTWGRNRSPNALENSGPAPFDYKQSGYSIGGPIPVGGLKDKLFFFAAQEWVDCFQIQTNTATVPTALMRTGNFSELLDPNNPFFRRRGSIIDPLTGQPFPGNIIPTNRLSPNGIAMLNMYPLPTPGFQQGTANLIQTSDNPQDQRKDNIRLDYRLNQQHQFSYRYGKYNWAAIDAFRGTFPFARTDWDRPNDTQTASWTAALSSTLINEFRFTHSLDKVFINVWQGTDLFKRSNTASTIRTCSRRTRRFRTRFPRSPSPTSARSTAGRILRRRVDRSAPSTTRRPGSEGPHTFKVGVVVEYSGQDDFDQINVRRYPAAPTTRTAASSSLNDTAGVNSTGVAIANAALGMFNNYAEIGQRALTKWRSLGDGPVRPGLLASDEEPDRRGWRALRVWPPWYSTTNNIATFDPAAYDTANQAVVNPSAGRIVSRPSLQRHRASGRRIRGRWERPCSRE